MAGDTLTYTLTASNWGPFSATGVVVTDVLPAEVTFLSATGPGVVDNGALTTIPLGTLAPGDTATIYLLARVSASARGTLTDWATIAANENDPNPANNSGSVTTQIEPPPLGTYDLLEGPAAGSNSDIVTSSGPWTAATNFSWLHVTASSGSGNGLVIFTFDANPGATRTGTLTIAGQTVTVTQAGSNYVAAELATLTSCAVRGSLAADAAGNVFFLGALLGAGSSRANGIGRRRRKRVLLELLRSHGVEQCGAGAYRLGADGPRCHGRYGGRRCGQCILREHQPRHD